MNLDTPNTEEMLQPIRYLDPKFDLAFKRLFGNNLKLLKSFLNAVLPLPEDTPIDTLEYLSLEHTPEVPSFEKYSIVDVKCKDIKGRIFTVEMQLIWADSFQKRLVFGGCQAFVKQLGRGVNYSKLQPVYALALVNEVFEPQTDAFYHHYKLTNQDNLKQTIPCLEFILIELPKFKPETATDKALMRLWLRFLNEVGKKEEQIPDKELQSDPDIAYAMEMMQVSAFNSGELETYHQFLDKWRTHYTMLEDAEQKGKEEGIEQGIEQGAHQKALDIAGSMKLEGLDLSIISKLTGLNIEVLKGI